MPSVRALLEDNSPHLTRDAIFSRLTDKIPSLVASWTDECKYKLLYIAQEALERPDVSLTGELLDLAALSFQCTSDMCQVGKMLCWPQILGHDCLRDVDKDDTPLPESQVYETLAWQSREQLGWEHSQ